MNAIRWGPRMGGVRCRAEVSGSRRAVRGGVIVVDDVEQVARLVVAKSSVVRGVCGCVLPGGCRSREFVR